MADSYVCSGAMMKCTMGTSPATLTVLPVRMVYLAGQPMANISDHQSMVNLAPFGLCRSLGFPATASATAAALGTLTPMPCMHNTPMPWVPGKTDYLIKGQPALLKSCTCQCMWGGTISLINNGQVGEGAQGVQVPPHKMPEIKEKNPESIESSDSFVAPLGKNARFTGIPKEPLEEKSDRCDPLKKRGMHYYNQWAYATTTDGTTALRQYEITVRDQDGKESKKTLTAKNYKSFSKKTLLQTLAIGIGFEYKITDLGAITQAKDGSIIGALGKYDPNDDVIIINENLLKSEFAGHDDLIEAVFHEYQHKNQKLRIDQQCLVHVPAYVKISDACVEEIKGGGTVSQQCSDQYADYENQWSEREAREVGAEGRFFASRRYKQNANSNNDQ